MKKICLIVPVYPPHFQYLRELIASAERYGYFDQLDIVVVFSSPNDYRNFGAHPASVVPFILPPDFPVGANIATAKKYYGLFMASASYEWLLSIDSECEFVRKVDLYGQIVKKYEARAIFSSVTINATARRINYVVASRYRPDEQLKLFDATFGFTEYFWYNEIPIYKSTDYREFYRTIMSALDQGRKLTWCDFEHTSFVYWLMLNRAAKLVSLTREGLVPIRVAGPSCLELIAEFDEATREKVLRRLNPFWVPGAQYADVCPETTCMIFHKDRNPQGQKYGQPARSTLQVVANKQ